MVLQRKHYLLCKSGTLLAAFFAHHLDCYVVCSHLVVLCHLDVSPLLYNTSIFIFPLSREMHILWRIGCTTCSQQIAPPSQAPPPSSLPLSNPLPLSCDCALSKFVPSIFSTNVKHQKTQNASADVSIEQCDADVSALIDRLLKLHTK